jgi:hypothetical protein
MKYEKCNGIKLQTPCSQSRFEKSNADGNYVDPNDDDDSETKVDASRNDVISALQLAVACGHSAIVADLMSMYM